MELKTGQLAIYGKITGRNETRSSDGKTFFHVEITTESKYPAVFDIWTQDAALAQVDKLPVGQLVTAIAWANGRKETTYKERSSGMVKALKSPRYRVSLRLDAISAAAVGDGAATSAPAAESVADDSEIPF